MYSFIDAKETTWFIGIGAPKHTLATHDGEKVWGWAVHLIAPDGKRSVEYQHNNLAEAIAQAVAKADWLRE